MRVSCSGVLTPYASQQTFVLEKMVRPLRANGSSFRVTGDVTAPIYSSNRRCKACNRSGMAGWGSEKLKHRKQGWQQVGLGLKCVST